jgi:hypothetical protein
MQLLPTLQTRVTGCGKSLSVSVLVAVVGVAGNLHCARLDNAGSFCDERNAD